MAMRGRPQIGGSKLPDNRLDIRPTDRFLLFTCPTLTHSPIRDICIYVKSVKILKPAFPSLVLVWCYARGNG